MRLLRRIVTSGGVAAFFFFSWVIMMLWNSIIVGHLELTKPLSYLQTCGLWFMITLFLAWTGIGMGESGRGGGVSAVARTSAARSSTGSSAASLTGWVQRRT